MRGRKPVPTVLKQIHGNPGKRRLNPNEPKPERGVPIAPHKLSKAEAAHWRRLVPILQSTRVLTVADGDILGGLCRAQALADAAAREVAKRGVLIEMIDTATKRIVVRPNPAIRILSDALRHVRGFATDLGLSPASRSRVTAAPDPEAEDDPLQRILGIAACDEIVN
jgi:P27 family predicted phage terminase small subunit